MCVTLTGTQALSRLSLTLVNQLHDRIIFVGFTYPIIFCFGNVHNTDVQLCTFMRHAHDAHNSHNALSSHN